MKQSFVYIILFTLSILSGRVTRASSDSLPGCITSVQLHDPYLFTEYEYKGQRWFSLASSSEGKLNIPHDIKTIRFYDLKCQLVCSWVRGGFVMVDKITPDTVERKKITTISTRVLDSNETKQLKPFWQLPDSILKLALSKNSREVKEYLYQDKKLYRLTHPPGFAQQAEKGSVTIDELYYNQSGKIILIYKRATKGMYSRAERWVPDSVKRSDVTEVPNGLWIREKNNYKKFQVMTDKK